MTLVGQAFAGATPRLEGSLSQDSPLVVTSRATVSVEIADGVVLLETGALRTARGGGQGGYLQVSAFGLTPGDRFMVLVGRDAVHVFTADASGLYTGRVTDRLQLGETTMVRHSGLPFATGLTDLQVVDLSSGAVGSQKSESALEHLKRDYAASTPLCSDDPAVLGEAMVAEYGDINVFGIYAQGLPPMTELTVIADGILVGVKASDEFGFFDFLAGNDPGADVPLPTELIPVSNIDEVLIDTPTQSTILFGSFFDPCTGGGGTPVASGTISICAADSQQTTGWMDWVIFDDGLQIAMVTAFDLPQAVPVDVSFNTTFIGAAPTSDWGELLVVFSSSPEPGMLPLPPTAPPLDNVDTVELTSGDVLLGLGTVGEECDWDPPPMPVDEDTTDLCPTENGNPRMMGTTTWAVWDDGNETFFVSAAGFEPSEVVSLVVDGYDLGAYTTSDWGDLNLFFSSNPNGGDNPGFGDALPLPTEIRPVDQIDVVSLFVDGLVVAEGSFVNGCTNPPPPGPVDEDWTTLCPTDPAAAAWGDTGWTVWDDDTEEFIVSAFGLEPQTTLNLVVDGHDLGAYTTSDWGDLNLFFSSNLDGGGNPGHGGSLPLPEEIRPVWEIDVVSLLVGDVVVVEGSFVSGCTNPPPPVPVDQDWTALCPTDPAGAAWGDTGWTVWDDDTEEFIVSAFGLEPQTTLNLVVDGHDLGAYTTSDWGDLNLFFSSNPNGGGNPSHGDPLLLPDEISPVWEIDQVSLVAPDGTVVLEGSFVNGCTGPEPPMPVDEGFTELCPATSEPVRGEVAWLVWDNGAENLMVAAHSLVPETPYSIVVDGHNLGSFDTSPDGGLWVDFASDPIYPDQVPLPSVVRPVSAIDAVEIRDAQGLTLAAGSFADPCSVEWEVQSDSTGLCAGDGSHAGDSSWWMELVNGEIVAQNISVVSWQADQGMTYSLEIDGIEVGDMIPLHWWGGLLHILNLGDYGDLPLPSDLSPVSGTDVVRVLDENGLEVATGSYSLPCIGQTPDGGGGPVEPADYTSNY